MRVEEASEESNNKIQGTSNAIDADAEGEGPPQSQRNDALHTDNDAGEAERHTDAGEAKESPVFGEDVPEINNSVEMDQHRILNENVGEDASASLSHYHDAPQNGNPFPEDGNDALHTDTNAGEIEGQTNADEAREYPFFGDEAPDINENINVMAMEQQGLLNAGEARGRGEAASGAQSHVATQNDNAFSDYGNATSSSGIKRRSANINNTGLTMSDAGFDSLYPTNTSTGTTMKRRGQRSNSSGMHSDRMVSVTEAEDYVDVENQKPKMTSNEGKGSPQSTSFHYKKSGENKSWLIRIRLKYMVALVVVLTGYHRLYDAQYIMRSFIAHNQPGMRTNYRPESSLELEIRGVTDTTTQDLYELYLSLNATGKKGWPDDDIIDDKTDSGGLCPICSSILKFFLSDEDPTNEEMNTPTEESTGNYSTATQDLYDLYLSLGEKSQKQRPLPGGRVESLDKTQRHRRLSNNSVNKLDTQRKDKIDTSSGNFCPICQYNENVLCEDRVKRVMKQRGSTKEEAIKSAMDHCASPPIQQKMYSEKEEPHIVFHVGPHKTGTTALQAFIYDLIYVNGTIFRKDNYRVPSYDELPGVFAKEGVGLNLPHCSLENYKRSGGQNNQGMCERMRKAFPQFALDAYNKAQNVLIVAEDFDRKEINFDRLRYYLRPYKKVKVVTTYRRLHDWLPSWYNQIMVHYNIKYAHGEEKYPSFVEWLNANYDEFVLAHSIEVANRFRKYDFVESIDVMNMHDASNLIEHFFCDHLQAKSVCHAVKEGFVPSKSNIGTDHDYERLAIRASLEGKISYQLHKPLHINRAPRHLKNKVEKANLQDKLPMICPPKALLDKIYETELEHEQTHFPKWFEQQGGKDGLRKSFDDAVTKKFCVFDDEKIFKTGILDAIFKEINPNVAPG